MTDKHTPTTAQPGPEKLDTGLRATLLEALPELEASAREDEARAKLLLDAAGFGSPLDEAMRFGAYALAGRAAELRKLIARAGGVAVAGGVA